MKLYTEEQVKRAMLHSYLTGVERPDDYLPIEDSILQELTPIELPSDEEIEKKFNTGSNRLDSQMYESGFRDGATWIKQQIQGGNK